MLYKDFIKIALSHAVMVLKDSRGGSAYLSYPPTVAYHFFLSAQTIDQIASGHDIHLSPVTIKDRPIHKRRAPQTLGL